MFEDYVVIFVIYSYFNGQSMRQTMGMLMGWKLQHSGGQGIVVRRLYKKV